MVGALGALPEPGSGGGGFSGMGIKPNGSFPPFCFSFSTSALRLSGSVGGINSEAVAAAMVVPAQDWVSFAAQPLGLENQDWVTGLLMR